MSGAKLKPLPRIGSDPPSPYERALLHIELHPGTSSARGLAMLLLSLWNGDDCGFSFRECTYSLDEERMQIAVDCVAHFALLGEDSELCSVGDRVYGLYPRLWDLGQAARDGKAALRAQWDAEWKAKCAREEREEAEARQRERDAEDREQQRDCGDAAEWDSPGVRK